MVNFLQGKKTYVVAVVVVVIGVTEGLLGIDVPGVFVGPDWLTWILTGLGLSSFRAAIGKK